MIFRHIPPDLDEQAAVEWAARRGYGILRLERGPDGVLRGSVRVDPGTANLLTHIHETSVRPTRRANHATRAAAWFALAAAGALLLAVLS